MFQELYAGFVDNGEDAVIPYMSSIIEIGNTDGNSGGEGKLFGQIDLYTRHGKEEFSFLVLLINEVFQ